MRLESRFGGRLRPRPRHICSQAAVCRSTHNATNVTQLTSRISLLCGSQQSRILSGHRHQLLHSNLFSRLLSSRCIHHTHCQAADTERAIPPESSSSEDTAATSNDAAVQEPVEAAVSLLNEVIEEVIQELFVDEGVAMLAEEDTTLTQGEVITRVVAAKLEQMNNSFLAALNAAIEMYQAQKEGELVELLVAVRQEVLLQIQQLLPAPIRVLNNVLLHKDKAKRMELMRSALRPQGTQQPEVTMENMLMASSQLITDMEEAEHIVDRPLLARLCLVREEVKELQDEMYLAGELEGKLEYQRSNVPQRCMAFLKELLSVSSQMQRVALLDKTFSEDWQGSAPKNSNMKFMAGEDRANLPDQVRPGRFLMALASTYRALVEQALPDNQPVVQKLDAVRLEALAVLDKIQRSS